MSIWESIQEGASALWGGMRDTVAGGAEDLGEDVVAALSHGCEPEAQTADLEEEAPRPESDYFPRQPGHKRRVRKKRRDRHKRRQKKKRNSGGLWGWLMGAAGAEG